MRFECDLHMVQTGIDQRLQVSRVADAPSVGIDAGDLPVILRIGDQFRLDLLARWARHR